MKKCPKCELNYIEDWEDLCVVCEETQKTLHKPPKHVKGVEVDKDSIHSPISPNAVYRIVRYLRYDYGEDDADNIYGTESPYTYRSILNQLKQKFPYAVIRYKSGAFKEYTFDGERVWNEFFLATPDYRQTIEHREIESIWDLWGRAEHYLSLPIKQRRV